MQDLIVIGASTPTIIRLVEDLNAVSSRSEERYRLVGFLDNSHQQIGSHLFGCPILGGFDAIAAYDPHDLVLINTIAGSVASRIETTKFFSKRGYRFANIVHPSVNIGHVKLGCGNLVYENATIHPFVELGSHCVVSSNSGIAHETTTGDYCFIGPRSYICGKVTLGDRVYVGAGAVVLPRLNIESDAVVGACSLVRRNVASGEKVFGVPAVSS